jgi:copper(I)-binding protein
MKEKRLFRLAAFGGALLLAQHVSAADVAASGGWVRWLPGGLPAAGYMTLENRGDKPVDIVNIDSPDYGSVMLHRSVANGSTQTMEMVDTLPLAPHETVRAAPGGYHLMLEQPAHAVKPGSKVSVQLHFSDGTSVKVPMEVRPPASR